MKEFRRKYRITESHLDRKDGITKLEKDGFSREEISRAYHKSVRGANHKESRAVLNRLYDREANYK